MCMYTCTCINMYILLLQVVTHELIPGGSGVPVTQQNKYVHVPIVVVF